MHRPNVPKRGVTLPALLLAALAQSAALSACDSTGKSPVSANRRHFDSLLANRDTALLRINREQDSMIAQFETKKSADSLFALPSYNLGAKGKALSQQSAASPQSATPAAGLTPAATPETRAASTPATAVAHKPLATSTTNARNARALALGDSIASANADRLLGNKSGAGSGGDTIRGIVQLQGKPPAARPILNTDSGHRLVELTGMASSAISSVIGADIVVRGLKVSALDVVVAGFVVRAVKGMPAVDGRLRSKGTSWTLELTEGATVTRLTSVPADLQLADGARVWIVFIPGTTTPKLFGVITRR